MGELYFTTWLFIADRVEVGEEGIGNEIIGEGLYYKVMDNFLDVQNLTFEKPASNVHFVPGENTYAIMDPKPLTLYMESSEIKDILTLDEALAFFERYKQNKKGEQQKVKSR